MVSYYVAKLSDSAVELLEYNGVEFEVGKYYFDYNIHRVIMQTLNNKFKLVNTNCGRVSLRDINGHCHNFSLNKIVREMLKRIDEKYE